jgi:phosphate transport system protein
MNQHIDKNLSSELEHIRNQLLCMGNMVEQQIELAMSAFTSGDFRVAKKGINLINQVDIFKGLLDKGCIQVLALRHPAGFELRFFITVIKISHELKLIGELAECIAKKAIHLTSVADNLADYPQVHHLSKSVKDMLHSALDTFAGINNNAIVTPKLNQEIDCKYADISLQLTTQMMKDPQNITRNLHILRIIRTLERIGDHSLHIYKELTYMLQDESKTGDYPKLIAGFANEAG